ncbi:hypothetical protein KFL_006320010 [Klebsormidium nitens]|uniref:Uncharacterized protein n=1 Tax=Klebsormidium nitens TaxID=105231 RepID=A0A1Y1IJQ5_KLENI|nr:hypothetical protein KFL_006320010 [Klebsormidium nitens]|eukprot:GAQ90362.1 hypothetical protein KFL_006320010 [Klebsormidium nitens]
MAWGYGGQVLSAEDSGGSTVAGFPPAYATGSLTPIAGCPNMRYLGTMSNAGPHCSSPDLCSPDRYYEDHNARCNAELQSTAQDLEPVSDSFLGVSRKEAVLGTANPLFDQSRSPSEIDLHSGGARLVEGARPRSSGSLSPSSYTEGLFGVRRPPRSPLRGFMTARQIFSTPERDRSDETDDLCQFASPWQGDSGRDGTPGGARDFSGCVQERQATLGLSFWERIELAKSGKFDNKVQGETDAKGGALPIPFGSLEASFQTPSGDSLPLAEPFEPPAAEEQALKTAGSGLSSLTAVAGVSELQQFSERLRAEAAAMDDMTSTELAGAAGIGRYRLSEGGHLVGQAGATSGGKSEAAWTTTLAKQGARTSEWGNEDVEAPGGHPHDSMRAIVHRILSKGKRQTIHVALPLGGTATWTTGGAALQEAYREEEDLDAWAWEDVCYPSESPSSPALTSYCAAPSFLDVRKQTLKNVEKGAKSSLYCGYVDDLVHKVFYRGTLTQGSQGPPPSHGLVIPKMAVKALSQSLTNWVNILE